MTVVLVAVAAGLVAIATGFARFTLRRRPTSIASRSDALLTDAEVALSAGRLGVAERGYRRIADALARPEAGSAYSDAHGRALVGLGEVARRQGRSADAIAAFRDAFTLTTLPAPALEQVAADATRHAKTDDLDLSLCVSLVTRPDTDPDHVAYEFLERHCTVTPKTPKNALVALERLAGRIEQGAPRTEWAIYGRACALRELGRSADALAAFERADALRPRAATGYALGRLYRDAGRPDDALAAFERSLAIEPERPHVLYAMALTHLRRKPSDETGRGAALVTAVTLLTRTCVLDPSHAQAWLGLGRAQRALGRPEQALEPLAKAAELLPDDIEVHMEYVTLTLDQGRREGAVPALLRVVAVRPEHVEANLLLGTLYDENGDFAAAQPCFARVVAAEPDHADGRFGLGRALFEQGEAAHAAEHLAAVRDRDAGRHHLLARAYGAAGDLDAADRAFGDAVAAGDDTARTHHRQGCVRLRAGRRADAIASFWRVLDRTEDDSPLAAEALLLRGLAYRDEGDLPAARADTEAALAAAPNDVRAHYARGCVAVAEHEWAAAQREFAIATRIDPDHAPARFGLALVRERTGDAAGAVAAYTAGLALRPDWTPAVVRLGATTIAAGRLAEGIEILGRVHDEPTGSARFHLGLAHARSGRVDHADELWASPGGVDDAIRAHNVATARDALARTALTAGDHAAARAHWQSCRDAFPDHEGYRVALAETLFREGGELLRFGRDGGPALTAARERLDAALALVPGDRRVRLHLAIAALYAGEPAIAVRLSAALDPRGDARVRHVAPLARLALGAGAVDLAALDQDEPAAWAVRGMQAARARRWGDAATAFRRALTEPGPVEPATVAAVCESADCTTPAHGACGQCGRACCAEHGVLVEALPARCAMCADATLAALSTCARENGAHPDAETDAVFAAWAAASGRPAARHAPALLRARRGDHDGALAVLLSAGAPGDPLDHDPAGRLIAARVHLRRAAANGARLAIATVDVERAAALEPELAAVRRALPTLRAWQALGHARAGRHEDALAIRLDLERAAPTDVRNLQCVAVSALRAGLADPPARTAFLWQIVCATWAAVLYSPRYWADLELRTGRELSPEQIHSARAEHIEMIFVALRERATRTDGTTAAMYRDLEQRWSLEVDVTARFARLDPAPAPLVCGPLMLARLTEPTTGSGPGRALAATLRAAADAHTLELLGPLGVFRHLIDVGRLDDAVGGLAIAAGLAGPQAPAGVAALLAQARVAQARLLGARGEWGAALARLEQAAPLPASVADLITAAGLGAADAALGGAQGSDHAAAARVLERALALPVRPRDGDVLRERLGATYARMSRRASDVGRHRDAIALIRKARTLVPGSADVRARTGDALRALAAELLAQDTPGALTEAVALIREACALDPGAGSRAELAHALTMSAERLALRGGERDHAVAALREALELDPAAHESSAWDAGGKRPASEAEARGHLAGLLFDTAAERERARDHDGAITLLDEARLYEDAFEVRRALAFNHYYARHYDEAEKLLRREIGHGPQDATGAVDTVDPAPDHDPAPLREAWAVVVTDWGLHLLATGRPFDAMSVLSSGLHLFEDKRIRDALVTVYLREDRHQDAIRAIEAVPLTSESTRTLALALYNEGVRQAGLGHDHTALSHLERAAGLHEDDATREILFEVRARINGYYRPT